MESLASKLLPTQPPDGYEGTEILLAAYRGFFDNEAGRLVLADLAEYSGFYRVEDLGTSGDVLAGVNGQRRVFARIFGMLRMTADEQAQLAEAAKRERIAREQQ